MVGRVGVGPWTRVCWEGGPGLLGGSGFVQWEGGPLGPGSVGRVGPWVPGLLVGWAPGSRVCW